MARLRLKPRGSRGHTLTHAGADAMAPAYVVHYRSDITGRHHNYGTSPRHDLRLTALGALEVEEFLRQPAMHVSCVRVTSV